VRIIELHPPSNGGTLYWGFAESARGRRYEFTATPDGDARRNAFREEPTELPDGRRLWLTVRTPPTLRDAVRKAVRETAH
jgi:hypothetical protein